MGRTLLNNLFKFLENSYSRFYDRISNCGRLDAGPRSRIGALSRHRGPGLTRGYAGGGVGHGGLGGGAAWAKVEGRKPCMGKGHG